MFDIFKKKIKEIKEITQSNEELIYISYFQDKLISENISSHIKITSINTGFVRNEDFGLSSTEPEYLNKTEARFKHDLKDKQRLRFLPQVDSFVLNIDIQLDEKNILTVQILKTQYAELKHDNCSDKKIEIKYTKDLFLNKTALTFEDFSTLFPDFLLTYNSSIKRIIQNRNTNKKLQSISEKTKQLEVTKKQKIQQKKKEEKILSLRN